MDPALWELLRAEAGADGDREIEAVIRLVRPEIEIPGVRIVSRFGTVATCRIRACDVIAVRARCDVLSVKASRILSQGFEPVATLPDLVTPALPSECATDVRRSPALGLTGAGVVVAAVDWGVDLDSAAFRWPDDPAAATAGHEAGDTRFLSFWDQRDQAVGPRPDPYGYGAVHAREEIDRALRDPRPYERLGYHPAIADRSGRGSHGTRTVDIAAGNGLGGGPVGIAPDADLIFVHLADRNTGGLANFGDSVRLLEAVDFISRTAGPQPCVINISAGRICGPKDGTTLVERALDELLAATPGRFVVNSGGNYFGWRAHSCGTVAPGEVRSLTFAVAPTDITTNELEIWYDGADELAVRIDPPGYGGGRPVRLGERSDLLIEGRVIGRVYHREHDPNNGDNHIVAYLDPVGRAGNWTVALEARRVSSGRFHAWIERDDTCPGCQARFTHDDSNVATTIGSIATSHLPLIVGAYDGHDPARPVAAFSSAGPGRDGRCLLPNLVAPGVDVLAARSAPIGASRNPGLLTRGNGTSFAAPHVTGALALCFEAAGHRLSAHEIRSLVLGSCDPVPDPGPGCRLGHGYLNIPRLIADTQQALAAPAAAPGAKEPTMDTDDTIVLLAAAPATAYREYLYRPRGQFAGWIADRYDVVARPGQRIGQAVQEGDVLLEVTLGQMSRGRCTALTAGDLQLVASWPSLPQGRLLLRPRRQAEMSQPLPVEPSTDGVLDASAQSVSSLESMTDEGTMEVALPGMSASPGTGATTTPLAPTAPGAGLRQDGIDIFQGNNLPALSSVTQAGFRFIIHKSSERLPNGNLITDSQFQRRWSAIGAAGIIRGSFHYYRHLDGATGGQQAATVASQVVRLVPGDLAPALDFEEDAVCAGSHEPDASAWRAELEAFLDGIEVRLGRTPIIYTGFMAWRDHIARNVNFHASDFEHFADYPLWVKHYPLPAHVTVEDIDHPSTPKMITLDLDTTPTPMTKTWAKAARDRAARVYQQERQTGQPAIPSPWSYFTIWQYSPHTPDGLFNHPFTELSDDFDVTRLGLYSLRGLTDLGRTAPHVVGNLTCIAYSEPGGKIYLVEFVGNAWRSNDVLASAPGAPMAAGDPAAVGVGNEENIVYRGQDQHVYALSRSLTSTATVWNVADITAYEAVGDPFATVIGSDVHVVYRDKHDHQSHLSRTAGAWHAEQLRGATAAGAAIGYQYQNRLHVVSRAGVAGHLVDLSPQTVDLTAAARDDQNQPPPVATYRPASYTPAGRAPRIVFRALRGSVWEIQRDTLRARNLSALAVKASGAGAGSVHAPNAAGSPTAVTDGTSRIFYRAVDGTIIEIFEQGGTIKWQEVCAGAAADPTAWVDATGAKVSFRGEDGSIRFARLRNGTWACDHATMTTSPATLTIPGPAEHSGTPANPIPDQEVHFSTPADQSAEAEEGAGGAATAKQVNEYQPDDATTLVINMGSFDTGITGIRNYKGWKTDTSVLHNKRYNGYRMPTKVIQIVIHETASDTGHGFDDTKNTTSHLAVQRDATIKQFNDLLEFENHTSGLNSTSIGIEFVNRGFLASMTADGGEGIPAHEKDLTAAQKAKYAEANGYIWTFWGDGFNIYKPPPADLAQLEKEVELLTWLTDTLQATINSAPPQFQSMFPWFEKTWLQLVSYNEIKAKWTFRSDDIPAATDQATKNLFVFTTGWDVLQPAQISGKRGIISHNANYAGHNDGSFLALYTWLRMEKGKTGQRAFDLCKSLMTNHWVRVRPKSDSSKQVIVLDVSDHNLV